MSYNIWSDDDNNNTISHSTNFLTNDNPFNSNDNSTYDIWKDNDNSGVLEREDSDLPEEEEEEENEEEHGEEKEEEHEEDDKATSEIENATTDNQDINRDNDNSGFMEPFDNNFSQTPPVLSSNILEDSNDEPIKSMNNDILQDIMNKEDPEDDIFQTLENAKPSIADLKIGDIDVEKNIFNDTDINIFSNNDEDNDNTFSSYNDNTFEIQKKTKTKDNKPDKKTHGRNAKKLFVMPKITSNPSSTTDSPPLDATIKQKLSENVEDILSSPAKEKTIPKNTESNDNDFVDIPFNTTTTTIEPEEKQKTTATIKSPIRSPQKLATNISLSSAEEDKTDILSIATDPIHQIEISEPYKVGDITNSFIEYKITTILSPLTVLKGRSLVDDDEYERTFIVKRRYSDFRWLYRQLQQSHWGIIIPSPPDKSLKNIIRVSDKDSTTKERKEVLLAMLTKMSSITELQFDPDYLEFLTNIEVTKLSQYYKIRDQETLSYALNDPLDLSEIARLSDLRLFGEEDGLNFYHEAKGMEVEQYLKKKIFQATRRGASSGTSGSSLTKAIFGFASNVMNDDDEAAASEVPRYNEPDLFFDKAEDCWDSLFVELKNLDTALKNLKESKEKSNSDLHRLADILQKLANSNITETLNKLYESFSNVQLEVSSVIKRSSDLEKIILSDYVQDQLRSLNNSTSIFNQRYKIGCILVLLEWIVTNKKFGKEILEGENLRKWEQRYTSVKMKWREIGVTIKKQLYKFDVTRVIEFRNCIEIYVETCKEQQKELIEIWETFYKVTL